MSQGGFRKVAERESIEKTKENQCFLLCRWVGFRRPRRPQDAPRWPQDAPRQPQGVPRWPQDAPKTPKRIQDAPRRGQDGRRQRQDGPPWPQDGSRWLKMVQDGQRWPPHGLKMAARLQMDMDVCRFAARRPPTDASRCGSLCRPPPARRCIEMWVAVPPAARPQMHRDTPRCVTRVSC